MTPTKLELSALAGIPLVDPGDDLSALITDALATTGETLRAGDVLVVAQKIFSKSEDRYRDLRTVSPSVRAEELAAKTEKDARFVELILQESLEVLRHRPGLIIALHRLGYVLANAGIDSSNVEPENASERVLLLPENPDASCERLRTSLKQRLGVDIGIVMNDSVGRAWRNGIIGMALGAAGLPSLVDLRGRTDLFGRPLAVTEVGLGDELAAAASILQGQADEGRPVVLVRGLVPEGPTADGAALVRSQADDLFR